MSEEKKGFFARLKQGLSKTRDNIVRGIDSVFGGFSAIDDDFFEELEEILIMGDIGVNATNDILERLKEQISKKHVKEPSECRQLLIDSIREQMQVGAEAYDFEQEKSVVMVIGVNGVGKTTSVGKLAGKLKEKGRKVLIAAADTFRAAAGDQLAEWARRADVPMVGGGEGADPASVVFDAVTAAKARGVDVLLIDMPPGTGDVALTILQQLPVQGVIMVSTPQPMVSMIVSKAVHMCEQMHVPVLGILENMAYLDCPHCGERIDFYNTDQLSEFLESSGLKLYGTLPMMDLIRDVSGYEGYDLRSREQVDGFMKDVAAQVMADVTASAQQQA